MSAGPIETQARNDVAALLSGHPMGDALAEVAYRLAGMLDAEDVKEMAAAGIARELRETLAEIARMGVTHDDLDEQLSRPSLPAPIRHPEDT